MATTTHSNGETKTLVNYRVEDGIAVIETERSAGQYLYL